MTTRTAAHTPTAAETDPGPDLDPGSGPDPAAVLSLPRLAALGRLVEDPAAFRAGFPAEPRLRRGAGDFTDLFGPEVMDGLLTDSALRRPAYRVIRDGQPVPDAETQHETLLYPDAADPPAISRLLAEGATLVFQGLQELTAPLSGFARRLAHDTGRPVNVNAYVTPARSQGFGDHYDTQDSFIVQIAGSKRWTLNPPVVERPLSHETWARAAEHRPGGLTPHAPDGAEEFTLHPGDCLWLPRGWVHAARSTDGPSTHLTISFYEWTAHWAWTRIAQRALGLPGRAALSPDFFRDRGAAERDIAALRTELIDWLRTADDGALTDLVRAAGYRAFRAPLQRPAGVALAGPVTEDTRFLVHEHTVLNAETRGDRLVLTLADRALTLPAVLTPFVADVLSRTRFTVRDLPDALPDLGDPDLRTKALTRLRAAGVVEQTDDLTK